MRTELEIIEEFYRRVCQRAEDNMLKTGKLEGAHFAAMKAEIASLKQAAQQGVAADLLQPRSSAFKGG